MVSPFLWWRPVLILGSISPTIAPLMPGSLSENFLNDFHPSWQDGVCDITIRILM